jgi:hypothetical protein
MQLMVYAPYGRTGIYLLQEFCKRVSISATDQGIHDLIGALRALPPGHPLENLLREAPDFREEAALADALLHPQDRSYSVPELFDFIERGGLAFGRWVRQAPYTPHCGVLARIPQADQLAQLSLADQYAAVELFRGTMVRHSVIVYRNDGPHGAQLISFAGDAWLDFVPIRSSDAICVHERLPPGAAAVLINQNHTFRDLFLPIDPTEKRMFDKIDGINSVSEIMKKILPSFHPNPILDKVRSFFERLWLYDQVVFENLAGHPSCRSAS